MGNFIITWCDRRNGLTDIYAQRYNSDGEAQGINFRVNDNSVNHQSFPSVAMDGSGGFIITWIDWKNGPPEIYAQCYNSEGTTRGKNFKVNDNNDDDRSSPSVASDENGNFIVVWEDQRNGEPDIYAQRFNSEGSALGTNFKINADAGSASQWNPSIDADGSGNFIITWCDDRNGISDNYAQLFNRAGTAEGINFKVNDSNNDDQSSPSVAVDETGNFIITWHNGVSQKYFYYFPISNSDIYAQRYDSNGNKIGVNFIITTTTDKAQFSPKVRICNGRIYNTWVSSHAGETGFDIWANVLDWNNPTNINDNIINKQDCFSKYQLFQNYPNPFNPSTTIEFAIPQTEFVELKIINLLGKEIASLVSEKLNPGNHTYIFYGKDLASGVYYYQLTAGNFMEVKKMIVLR